MQPIPHQKYPHSPDSTNKQQLQDFVKGTFVSQWAYGALTFSRIFSNNGV